MKFYTKLASLCALFFAFTAQAQFTHPMLFEVNSPSSIARSYTYGPQSGAGWGITALPSASVSGPLVWAYDITPDSLVCDTITNTYAGQIVLIRRGTCNFSLKMYYAQQAGAIGCVICNNNGGSDVINMAAGTNGAQVTIPAVSLSSQDCDLIAAELSAGNSITATFRKPSISSGIGFYGFETPQSNIQTIDSMYVSITNVGTTTQTNISSSVQITDPNGNTTSYPASTASLQADSTVQVSIPTNFTANATGTYNMVYRTSLSSDSITSSFSISSNRWGLDRQNNYTWIGVTDAGYATAGYRFDMGNCYLTGPAGGYVNDAQFSLFNGGLYMGQVFQARLYLLPQNLTGGETDYSTFTLAGIGIDTIDAADTTPYTIINVDLLDPNTLFDSVPLLANRQYLMVMYYQGDSNIIQGPRFSYSGNDELLSLGSTVFTDRLYLGGFTGDPHPVIRMTFGTTTPTAVTPLVENTIFNVYPNPVSDLLNIDLSFEEVAENATISIIDVNGRMLQELEYSQLKQQTVQLNTSALSAGYYFVRVQTEKGIQTKEFVKK